MTFKYRIIENKSQMKLNLGGKGKHPKKDNTLFSPNPDMEFIEFWEDRLDSLNEPYVTVEVLASYLDEEYVLGYTIVLDRNASYVFNHEDSVAGFGGDQ